MPHRFSLVLPEQLLATDYNYSSLVRRAGWQELEPTTPGTRRYRVMTDAEKEEAFYEDGGVVPVFLPQ